MDVFCYTPGGAEALDNFNQRLAKYAVDNNIVGVVSSVISSTLVLSLATDKDVPGMLALRPFVVPLQPDNIPSLEHSLDGILSLMKAEDKPNDGVMSLPVELRVLEAKDSASGQIGYALFLVAIGDLEPEALEPEAG